jgi:hypothetical protein
MSHDPSPSKERSPGGWAFAWLEWITAAALVGVVLALGWITVAPHLPGWGFLPTVEAEVIVVLVLLAGALVLVSVVALLHTRG